MIPYLPQTATLLAQGELNPTAAPATSGSPGGSSLFDIIFSGGPIGVAIMLVLIGLSIAAVYLVFDMMMTLRKRELSPDGLSDSVRQSLLRGSVADADAACRRQPSVLSYTMLMGLGEVDLGWPEVEKVMEETLAEQSARLLRKIEYLAVIGNIAPMVGLLGTVTGMIIAFQQVAVSDGSAGAGDLAEGIYQALVTTVGGLVIAIPSLGAYAVGRNRVDSLIADVAHQTIHAMGPIKRRVPARRGDKAFAGPVTAPISSPVSGSQPTNTGSATKPSAPPETPR